MKTTNVNIDDEVLLQDDMKIDQIEKTYVLMDHYWSVLEKNLPKNILSFIRFVAKYRNLNIKAFVTPYPTECPPWTPICNRIIYETANIKEDDFIKDVLTIRGWQGYVDKYLKDKSPYILLLMIARWCMINHRDKELNIVCHYIGYAYYWQIFYRHFKKYNPNPNVMRYTIEEMSYKSKLKALGSVDAWLYDGVWSALKSYEERLMRASDFELHYINEKIHGKFSNAMKTLHSALEKNEKEKNYIFITSTIDSDDNISDNTYGSADIATISDSYASKFFEEPINEEALKNSLIPGGITEKDLRTTIIMISDSKENLEDVRKLFQSIFTIFLSNKSYKVKDIGTMRFYFEMEKAYKPGNSVDPNKIFIKDILDKWLTIGSKTFRNTTRTPTITTFRKSLYEYFILKIMKDR